MMRWTAQPMPPPSSDAEQPAERGEERRFHQELEKNLGAARAERLADADFARPLGHRDRHDRHHADAADHQGDRRDHDQREKGPWLIWSHSCRMASWVTMSKSFGSSSSEAVADAHDPLDIGDRVLLRDALSRQRGDLDRQDLPRVRVRPDAAHAEHALIGRVRNDDEIVLAEVESAGRRTLVEHADDLVAFGADADDLADRIGPGRREQQPDTACYR